MSEIYAALANSPERRKLVAGLIGYRDTLRAAGIVQGYQLIDGSFTEDCEKLRGRAPDDVDLVTFGAIPVPRGDVRGFMVANPAVFSIALAKSSFWCHVFFVDLGKPAITLVEDSAYWHGLFTHQRVGSLWKGCLRLGLRSDDDLVRAQLQGAGVVIPKLP